MKIAKSGESHLLHLLLIRKYALFYDILFKTKLFSKIFNKRLLWNVRFAALEEEITVVKQVFHKDQSKITDTLAAIMARLTTMEEKQDAVALKLAQNQHLNYPIQPTFRPAWQSPMVPQPGTLTQGQWASQNQNTQSQC